MCYIECVLQFTIYTLISGSEETKTIKEFRDGRKQRGKRKRSQKIIAFEEKKKNGESKRKKDYNYSSAHLQMTSISIQVITLILVFILQDELCFFVIDKQNNHSY